MKDFASNDFGRTLKNMFEAKPRDPRLDPNADEMEDDFKPSAAGSVSSRDVNGAESDLAGMLDNWESKWNDIRSDLKSTLSHANQELVKYRKLGRGVTAPEPEVSDDDAMRATMGVLDAGRADRMGSAPGSTEKTDAGNITRLGRGEMMRGVATGTSSRTKTGREDIEAAQGGADPATIRASLRKKYPGKMPAPPVS